MVFSKWNSPPVRRFQSAPLRKSHTSVLSKSDLFTPPVCFLWSRSVDELAGLGVTAPPPSPLTNGRKSHGERRVFLLNVEQQHLVVTAAPRLGHIPGKHTRAEWHHVKEATPGEPSSFVSSENAQRWLHLGGIEVGLRVEPGRP